MNLKSLALAALMAGSAALAACSSKPPMREDDPSLPPLAGALELSDLTRPLKPYDYTVILAGLKTDTWQPTGDMLYYHHYRTVWQTPQGTQRDSTPWRRITKEQYDNEVPLEGLAVASRQNGQMLAGPVAPEMAFVGNPTYGHWTRGPGGDSFWEWYGKYAMMRDLFGGPRHTVVIHRTEYNTYRRNPTTYRSARPEMPSFRTATQRPSGFDGRVADAMDRPVVSRSRSGSGYRSSRSTSGGSSSYGSGSTYSPPRASSSYGSRSSGGGSYYSPPRSSYSSRSYSSGRSYSPPSTRSSGWGSSRSSGRRRP